VTCRLIQALVIALNAENRTAAMNAGMTREPAIERTTLQ
jgi:hypothetical protein